MNDGGTRSNYRPTNNSNSNSLKNHGSITDNYARPPRRNSFGAQSSRQLGYDNIHNNNFRGARTGYPSKSSNNGWAFSRAKKNNYSDQENEGGKYEHATARRYTDARKRNYQSNTLENTKENVQQDHAVIADLKKSGSGDKGTTRKESKNPEAHPIGNGSSENQNDIPEHQVNGVENTEQNKILESQKCIEGSAFAEAEEGSNKENPLSNSTKVQEIIEKTLETVSDKEFSVSVNKVKIISESIIENSNSSSTEAQEITNENANSKSAITKEKPPSESFNITNGNNFSLDSTPNSKETVNDNFGNGSRNNETAVVVESIEDLNNNTALHIVQRNEIESHITKEENQLYESSEESDVEIILEHQGNGMSAENSNNGIQTEAIKVRISSPSSDEPIDFSNLKNDSIFLTPNTIIPAEKEDDDLQEKNSLPQSQQAPSQSSKRYSSRRVAVSSNAPPNSDSTNSAIHAAPFMPRSAMASKENDDVNDNQNENNSSEFAQHETWSPENNGPFAVHYSPPLYPTDENGVMQLPQIPPSPIPLNLITIRTRFYTSEQIAKKQKLAQKIIADKDGLPLHPTWSVKSLFALKDNQSISIVNKEQVKHLFRLCNLREPKNPEHLATFVRDINRLCHFVKHIQEVDVTGVPPMRGIWPEGISVSLRSDNDDDEDKDAAINGRALLKCAKVIQGNYYVVKGRKIE
ncbi:6883_t:CDS:2 [Ambispora leptoticha]|uniref:6883_t:CDS:1 n=1 Tax=Ambispora leptoticha TaxID=144679 RepID=A0A9N8ZEF4_9GLOM|nr:6883_t:CDS:2 [Ambispora leptoticha]